MKLLHVKYSACLIEKVCFGSVRRLYQNFRVCPGKLASFEVTLKTVSKKMKKIELIQINAIFVHWI